MLTKLEKKNYLFLKSVNKQLKSADIFFSQLLYKKFHKIKSSWHWKLSTRAKYLGQKIKNKEKQFSKKKFQSKFQNWPKFSRLDVKWLAPNRSQEKVESGDGVRAKPSWTLRAPLVAADNFEKCRFWRYPQILKFWLKSLKWLLICEKWWPETEGHVAGMPLH